MASPKLHMAFRKYHRWLGFFLAGIMAVYAISGILLIFRPTDFLKFEQTLNLSLQLIDLDKLSNEDFCEFDFRLKFRLKKHK